MLPFKFNWICEGKMKKKEVQTLQSNHYFQKIWFPKYDKIISTNGVLHLPAGCVQKIEKSLSPVAVTFQPLHQFYHYYLKPNKKKEMVRIFKKKKVSTNVT